MALSEREQQVLRDLEQQLHDDDPSLEETLKRTESSERVPLRFSPRHVGAGIAMVLTGMVVVLAGVAVAHGWVSVVVGVLGFALAVWGMTLVLTRVDPQGGRTGVRSSRARSSGFMARQSERWNRRHDADR